MDKEEKVSFDLIIYAMMIVGVVYAIIQSLLGNNNEFHFKLTLGIWILAAVILTDYVEPAINKEFDSMSSKKIGHYVIYAILDAFAYVFMYLFVINIGMFKEPFHYIFLMVGGILFIIKVAVFKTFKSQDNN